MGIKKQNSLNKAEIVFWNQKRVVKKKMNTFSLVANVLNQT